MELKEDALPLPLAKKECKITSLFSECLVLTSSAFEVIIGSAFLPEGETLDCPMVDGTFPQDGFPAEDITVTGGCTNSEGVNFKDLFVYDQQE